MKTSLGRGRQKGRVFREETLGLCAFEEIRGKEISGSFYQECLWGLSRKELNPQFPLWVLIIKGRIIE